MSLLNNKTTKVIEFNTCPNSKFNNSVVSLLEEEGGLVITHVDTKVLQFRYLKHSKFRFSKRGYINSRVSNVQHRKAITQYKKPIYFRQSHKICSNKLLKDKIRLHWLFATRV